MDARSGFDRSVPPALVAIRLKQGPPPSQPRKGVIAMTAWIKDMAIRIGRLAFASNRRDDRSLSARRRKSMTRNVSLHLEGLERREVLSTSSVTPFLTLSGQIPSGGQTASVDFHLSSGTFAGSKVKSAVLVGLDPRPADGSTLTPTVTSVMRNGGLGVAQADGANGSPFIGRLSVPATGEADYVASVRGPSGQSGGFLVDAFLAGDVNGDLTVDRSDLDRIIAAYGSSRGNPRYDAAADINQDGTVGCLDRTYAVQNLGAKAAPIAAKPTPTPTTPATIISPVASPQVVADPNPPAVAVAPVTVEIPTAVNPPLAVSPVTAVPVSQPTPTSNVVWIPVILQGSESPAQVASLGGLTWSPQASAYYPSVNGTATVATLPAPVYYTTTNPTAAVATSPTPVYYTTQPAATPGGPLYYTMPTGATQAGSTSNSSTAAAVVSR